MKKVQLAYGKGNISIEVPDNAVIVEPPHIESLADEKGAVVQALRHPTGTPPLKEMVKASDTVAIVISDITRPTPNHKLVPWIIEELSHVPKENFVVINGLGSHRHNTREELISMLGQEVVDTIRVINHEAFDDNELVHVGRNSYGSEVYLNKTYVEADFKIVTGFIEPHFFAGFSGGPKGINPGIVGIKTIQDFHNAEMIGNPKSTWGVIEGNGVQDAATQNCLMAKPQFMLNVTLNGDKEITNVFAGDVIQAHRVGCEFVKHHAMVAVDHPFDIVITTNAGYPLDQNLYQTVKGMSAGAQIVKEGGSIISVAECSDGLPSHGNFGPILKMRNTPQALLDMINEPSFSMFDQWEAQALAMIQVKADCYLYSTLDKETVADCMLQSVENIEQTLAKLIEKYGSDARVAVLPLGPLVVPYVAK
ncbi:nickel-dependent lactate racemase [Pelosinus propionicus]|uniref:Nickel-dependent lactate racemase n=1 Tax=Pelosinus propionicus DSM 13327 TaxID=1123291 RepID=A0A1I4KDV7_9FIRM|nr:nickel-dependent lactate racemase [Pelosinus propionicus]SFL76975.1 Nickel-dependent lactate racemase [Pelosinus propionicus DSM 13327]